ncbi:MAG: DUF4910 domain-containing protein, partial [Symbiobacteriaceae bacterium]|nr:DUF4910 domain-containing protein [Symbiobacteriaceae bacterium]
KLMQKELSGDRAFQHVAKVSSFHRIQSSPGYRAAAEYCLAELQKAGVSSRIISYPSDYGVQYWTQKMWEEWSCEAATLELLEPSWCLLADYSVDKISIIQRSYPTPPEGVEAPLILLDNGDDEEGYPGVDFSGAVVFTGGDANIVRSWAVEKRGAIGIVSDRLMEFPPVRHRYDIPDAMQYTSFWWSGKEKPCFGFVLSPKGGDMLRRAVSAQKEKHRLDPAQPAYLKVLAKVDAKLYPGAIENVEAFIPGETSEEVLLEAHLCHPQASANDNASGVGVLLEVAGILQKMINNGNLPRPQRGIRFLLIPEMTGTYAWLSQNEERLGDIKAGLNLDMVGEKQELCQGPFIVEYPPQAAFSFVGDLAAAILDEVALEAKNLGGTGSYALFKHTTAPFSGGSDHYILSDPTVGIPAPMLIQWPDKFYHTSADTIDKVDPMMLYRVACLTATYGWLTANIGKADLSWLQTESRTRYLTEIGGVLRSAASTKDSAAGLADVRDKLNYLLMLRKEQLASLANFVAVEAKAEFAEDLKRQQDLLTVLTEKLWQEHLAACGLCETPGVTKAEACPKMQRTPKRTFRGPWNSRSWIEELSPEDQEAWALFNKRYGRRGNSTILVYWIDGKRTLAEVCDLVALETGSVDKEYCLEFVNWMTKLGLIEWV